MARILIAPSCDGLLPDAVKRIIAEAREQDKSADWRSDSRIIDGIEKYAGNWFDQDVHTEKYLKEHADTELVLLCENIARNGIICRTYVGYSRKHHCCKKAGICEYDEKSLRVMIREYNGEEMLVPIPEYKCVNSRLNFWKEKWEMM